MLIQVGPDQWHDPSTGTTATVHRKPYHVEYRTPAGVRRLYNADAERAVDALTIQLLRQHRSRTAPEPLWPLWSGCEIPYDLAGPSRRSGTVELLNGEPREEPVPVLPDGSCACLDHR